MSLKSFVMTDQWRVADRGDADSPTASLLRSGVTGTAVLMPVIPDGLRIPDDPRAWSLASQEIHCSYHLGRLIGPDGLDGVRLVGWVDGVPIPWRVSRSLRFGGEALPRVSPVTVIPVLEVAHLPDVMPVDEDEIEGLSQAVISLVEVIDQTGRDRVATGEDRDRTGRDRVATGEDRDQTGRDRVATGEDRDQTGRDRVATGEDRDQTGRDRVATEASDESAHLAASSAAASTAAQIRDEIDSKVSEANEAAQAADGHRGAAATAAGAAHRSATEATTADTAIRTTYLPEARGLAQATSQDRDAVKADREAVESTAQDVESHRDDIIDAADRIGTAAQVEGWSQDAKQASAEAQGAVEEARQEADRAESATEAKADLVEGKIPTSQIPAVALTKPHSVPSVADMLALDVQEGDIAVITQGDDLGTYMLGEGPGSSVESWVELTSSAEAPVQSVNGQTGTVVLAAADISAAPEDHTHRWQTLREKPTQFPPEGHRHSASQVDGLESLIDARARAMVMEVLREVPLLTIWDGEGEWPAGEWASTVQGVLDLSTQDIHSVIEEES